MVHRETLHRIRGEWMRAHRLLVEGNAIETLFDKVCHVFVLYTVYIVMYILFEFESLELLVYEYILKYTNCIWFCFPNCIGTGACDASCGKCGCQLGNETRL